ncbi:hypothetical protein O3W44_13615 [Pantoea sp. LMR881]|uniref:hypothetical protein n=1 Tax=Pantoea sp. LMR881 TaxID=3014336 RepID=UPI0022B01FA3|nr:hypothetical protein [Pantoea sp. LMR881]MCZ4059898.1 hypothetical protein [Pantoea sp. LMR881]
MALIDTLTAEVSAKDLQQARTLCLSGNYERVRLTWNISSDQFFTLAAEFDAEDNIRMARDNKGFYLERYSA